MPGPERLPPEIGSDTKFSIRPLSIHTFLGTLYAASGDEIIWIRMAQAALGAAGCGLLLLATARFFQSVPAGVVAGLTLAFFAPGIFHDTLIQKSVLDLFFLSLLLWSLAHIVDRPRMSTWCAAGAILGCLILTRENSTLLAFAIFFWMFFQFREAGHRRIAFAACFLVGLCLILAPVAARNYVLSGEIHLTTSQLGPNLYIGNHKGATGTYVPLRWGRGSSQFERDDAVQLAERESGQKLNARQTSQYWQKRAIDYVLTEPADWLRVTGLKFALLWNATEVIDTEDQYTYAEFSPPLLALGSVTHFGIISPLALLGLIITWPQRKRTLDPIRDDHVLCDECSALLCCRTLPASFSSAIDPLRCSRTCEPTEMDSKHPVQGALGHRYSDSPRRRID